MKAAAVAAVILWLVVVFTGGCRTEGTADPLHPGVEQLTQKGMPSGGTGLPPGAMAPAPEPNPVPVREPDFMKEYRIGVE